jgi:hypothetical protein
MTWLIARLKEPSTLAGLSALGMLFGLPPGTMDAVGQIVTGGMAIAAMVIKEKGNA